MIYKSSETSSVVKVALMACSGVLAIILVLWSLAAIERVYAVWAQGKAGEAELARADSNRRIKTLEAKAAEESAKYLADAEIIRAEGVAAANKIIGDSLKGNEAYLRYLWVTGMGESKHQTIYIPTEAGMPILEAGRLR